MNKSNNTLLIIGAFPKIAIYGGIYRSCKLILDSPHFSDFKLILFDSSQISNPPPLFLVRFFLAGARLIRFLFQLLVKRPNAALIFCSDGASALEKGLMVYICKIFRVKTLIFPRAGNLIKQTERSVTFRILIKHLFSKCSIFFAQGENWKQFAKEELNLHSSKIKIIRNWTATKDLIEVGSSRKYGNKKTSTNFLFVGWLEKEKGLYEILKAIKFLHEKNYIFSFTFIGDGRGMKPAIKFITENGLLEKVFFKGWVPHNSIKQYYQAADVFVLPSWAEGMPNALIEALSCGLASVVSNVGMIPNYLVNEKNALIIPPKDSLSLSNAMEKLILNRRFKINISKNGYEVANEYFSSEKGLELLAKSIKKL